MKYSTSQSELFKSVYIARNLKIQHKNLRPGFPGGSVVKNHLTVPETRVRVLIQENFTRCEQLRLCSEPRSHNYWSPHALEPMLLNNKGNCNWEACTWNESIHPSPQLEKSPCSKRLNKTKNKPKNKTQDYPVFIKSIPKVPFKFCKKVMCTRVSLVAQMVKRMPAEQETQVQSLGWEDPLKKETAAHSSILAGKFHGLRSLVGYSPWGRKELDTTERLHLCVPSLYSKLQEGKKHYLQILMSPTAPNSPL